MKLQPAVPVLRIFNYAMAKSLYADWLGFKIDWEHHPQPTGPVCLEVSRDACVIHLTEHYGDGSPGVKVYVHIDDVDAYHRELATRPNPNMNPSVEDTPWGTRSMGVIDPFGNRIYFSQRMAR
jgi:catechol 2,3-dioxygenase-like lactoylglutathione lyase family enzyme